MNNNEVIDGPDYYLLPCGKYLEDYIYARNMTFALGSAVKYAYRAGRKRLEPFEKDLEKVYHYCRFIADRHHLSFEAVRQDVLALADGARKWDGRDDMAEEEAETEGWTK